MTVADKMLCCTGSVSYTHLDVYKRQIIIRAFPKLFKMVVGVFEFADVRYGISNKFQLYKLCFGKWLIIGIKSVSYTHLDVYKRQGFVHVFS